ncbi:MAG: TetR/AcrR family transcriptional regulator [Candidatus Binatia bacterium]
MKPPRTTRARRTAGGLPRQGRAIAPRVVSRRAQQRGLDTRQRILLAALSAFADHGYEGAMTRDIARAAGVQQPLLNYHFGSKSALWEASITWIFDELRRTYAETFDGVEAQSPEAALRVVLRELVRFNARHPELSRVMIKEAAAQSERLEWIVGHHLRPLFDTTHDLLRAVQHDGRLRAIAPVHLYYMMIGAAGSIFTMAGSYRLLTGADPFEPRGAEAYADAIVRLFCEPIAATGRRGRTTD